LRMVEIVAGIIGYPRSFGAHRLFLPGHCPGHCPISTDLRNTFDCSWTYSW
jgi:hypothetical protein